MSMRAGARSLLAVAAVSALVPGLFAQDVSLRRQLDSAAVVASSLATPEAAERAGYHRIAPPSLTDLNPFAGEHWIQERYNRTRTLDLAHPAYLMYYPHIGPDSLLLVGVGYTVALPAGESPPPGFDSEEDRWHIHLPCQNIPGIRTTLAEGIDDCRSLGGTHGPMGIAMVHVWTGVQSPDGPFALFNTALPYLATDIEPPSASDLADPKRGRFYREVAFALGETYGAVPRMGARIAQDGDSVFADRVRPHRERIRALLPALRTARHDSTRFRAQGERAIAEWREIRDAYLESAYSAEHRMILDRWFQAALAGHHRGQLSHGTYTKVSRRTRIL